MSLSKWWPWGHREPSPETAAQAEDAEWELNESLRRKRQQATESQRHLNLAKTLSHVTARNHFAEHIEAAYRSSK